MIKDGGGERQTRGQCGEEAGHSVLRAPPVPGPCTSTRGTAWSFQTGSRATGGRRSAGLGRYERHPLGAARSCCSQSGWRPGPGSTSPPGPPALRPQQNLDIRGSACQELRGIPAVTGFLVTVKSHSEDSYPGKLAPSRSQPLFFCF